jgi:hypothetical protein
MAENKPKKTKPAPGQVAALPLQDGSFGLGHVAAVDGSITVALFARRARSPEELAQSLDAALREPPIATLVVTADELRNGEWPVIGAHEPSYAPALLDKKGASFTAAMARSLLSAYHGLIAWDMMADARYFEKLLLPGVKVPPTVRSKSDLAAGAKPPAAAESKAPAITSGPAQIHIQIVYPGDGLPSEALLRRRRALEEKLEARRAGEITDAGGGGGVMDVHLETEDVRRALPLVRAAVAELGFEKDTLIEVEPLDD